eukprot:snap_masked-scaffold_2-processed-gene-13.32-mRNA-1 protein AED:1.00 eAED:1.00 QI:0/-1/0/0/-1/1/1/0/80
MCDSTEKKNNISNEIEIRPILEFLDLDEKLKYLLKTHNNFMVKLLPVLFETEDINQIEKNRLLDTTKKYIKSTDEQKIRS